jgi:hypothetical protein
MSVIRNIGIGIVAAVGAAYVGYRFVVRPWWQTWGANAEEAGRALPGDDVVPDGLTAETRAITIDAPRDAVWPWLVQMGLGRAGFYSYDTAMDKAAGTSDRILPEHQHLQVGDLVPIQPGGGFVVRSIDPERELVLYLDAEMARQQAEAQGAEPVGLDSEEFGSGAQVTAAVRADQIPEFAISWAFVLEDAGPGRTLLTERVRVRFGETDKPWTRQTIPLMGFGAFVMMRKQLLGIKARAEGASVVRAEPLPEPETIPS